MNDIREAKEFLRAREMVDAAGKLTDAGACLLSALLDHVGQYPNLTPIIPSPYGIFEKFMSRTVPSCVELVLVRDGSVYLTYRKDKFWKGYHVPGSYIAPGETLVQTAQRIADREIPGVEITSANVIGAMSYPESPRFHDAALIVVAEFTGCPMDSREHAGNWFGSKPPSDLIDVHRPYWPIIQRHLEALK